MTAAEQYADANRVLSEMRAVLVAGTPTPWFQGRDSRQFESAADIYSTREPERAPDSHDIATYVWPVENAALITLAVNALGPMLDGWESVLGRHRPIDYHGLWICSDHYRGMLFHGPSGTNWPCPDARAVLGALGIEVGT